MQAEDGPKTTCDVAARAEGLEFGMMTVTVPPGRSTEEHEHRSQELWVVHEGHGHVTMPGVALPLRPGPATSIPADTPHSVHSDGDVPLVLLAFWWKSV